jgi:outer membrane lipopolysaccharide assembly protein LptE/RlpB
MKALGVSLALGMMVIFLVLCGYWLRNPYAITAQWDESGHRSLEPENMMRNQVTR